MKIHSISFLLLLSACCFILEAQKGDIIEDYETNIREVINAESVVYYGIDFSKAVLTDINKIGTDEYCRKYFSSWVAYFETLINPEDIGHELLKKAESSRYNPVSVQLRYVDINHKWISVSGYSFSVDTLKSIIKSYRLKENSGLGFVINVENLNKESLYISAYLTFFDIATKDILWAVKVRGKPGGGGMSSLWSEGIYNVLMIYVNDVYKRRAA